MNGSNRYIWKSSVFDKNTLYHINMCKQVIIDKNVPWNVKNVVVIIIINRWIKFWHKVCPFDWGCSELRPSLPNQCPGYVFEQSDVKAPAWEIWGMWSTPSLPLLLSPLWTRVVALDRVLFMGQIEQTVCKQITGVKLWLLYHNTWNHLTMCKKSLCSF